MPMPCHKCNRAATFQCPVCHDYFCVVHMIHGVDHAPGDRPEKPTDYKTRATGEKD